MEKTSITNRLQAVLPTVLLTVIIIVGAYLRLHDIHLYMTFLGDEGRDVLIVRDMITEGKWTLLGPTASVGGFYMGPIYYYFMLPFLWAWNFNPVGPAIMVSLFGIATIGLVYIAGKRMFSEYVGLVAAGLYAISPFIISYSRSSWNPNIVPFFSILLFFLLWDIVRNNHWNRLFWVGIILGIELQLHYTVLALFAVVALWFFIFGRTKERIKYYLLGVAGFFLGFLPFLLFEFRHGFMNIRSIALFVFEGKDTGFALSHFVSNIGDVYFRLFGRLLFRLPEFGALGNLPFMEKSLYISFSWILAILCGGVVLFLLFNKRRNNDPQKLGLLLMSLWTCTVLLFFGFYKKSIYDYYFGIMYFVPFLAAGILFSRFCEKKGAIRIVGYVSIIALCVHNLIGMPFRYAPNNQLGQVERIARDVIAKTDGKPFNFALITGGNSDHAYRYFFELWGNTPVSIENEAIDPQRQTVADQLLVVCEDTSCKPLGNSLWEVAGFGQAEIVSEEYVSVVKVYKLVHYSGEDGT